MNWDLTTRRWQKAIVADAERTLGRPLRDYEKEFITSRGGYVALEMIHDTVKTANKSELESYLASERKATS
jgi:hypothetical protein